MEIFGLGAQLVAGGDYYLLEGFFVGAEIKPVFYCLAQIFLKLGFRF